MKETHSRKLRKREGSAIPESSLRQDLADAGVSFMGSFTAYFLGNVSGGLTRDFAYNHMLFFQLNLDLEKIMNWKGGTIVWSFADNAGSDLSTAVGNNFQISTDYGPNTFMFDEFYFMQTLLDGKLHIKLGQMSLLNDFMASPLYDVYANLAFCGKPVKLLVAASGFTISLLAFVISFFPPSSLTSLESERTYVGLLIVSFLVIFSIPFIIYALHDKKSKGAVADMVHIKLHNAPEGHFWMHPRARSSHHLIPTEGSVLSQEPEPPAPPKA